MLTKNAMGNLINRYKSVLKKCALLNACAFALCLGSLGVADINLAHAAGLSLRDAWNSSDSEYTMTESHTGEFSQKYLTKDFTIDGNGNRITGTGDATYDQDFVMKIGNGGKLTIQNITIENYIQEPDTTAGKGGAIHVNNYARGWLTINEDVTIQNNNFESGAGVNNNGTLTINGNNGNVKFLNNTAEGNDYSCGGAINNNYEANIAGTLFKENKASATGGAVHNSKLMTIANSTFTNNESKEGGGIYNGGDINISHSTFEGNKSSEQGGAISNRYYGDNSTMDIQSTTFEKNESGFKGGAIYNYSNIENIQGSHFIENKGFLGGAINNEYVINNIQDSTFSGNNGSYGGAIYNTGYIQIQDSTFSDNISSEKGGAIHNSSDASLIIVATDDSATGVQFSGNKADDIPNAIYNQGGEVYLRAESNSTILFDDGIENANNGTISIGGSPYLPQYNGTVTMNNIIRGDGTVQLNMGTFKLGAYPQDEQTTNFTNEVNLVLNGGIIDMQNNTLQRQTNIIQRQTPKSVTLGGNVTMKLDVNLDNQNSTMDGFKLEGADNYIGTGNTINLDLKINEASATDKKIYVPFTEGGAFSDNIINLEGTDITDGIYTGAVYEYDVAYIEIEDTDTDLANTNLINGNSYISFERESINPEVLSADVAAANLFIFHDEIYTRLFRMHNATKVRVSAKEEGVAFMSAFGGDENLDLDNFSHNIDLKTMGTIVGYEGARQELAFDTDVFCSVYGAYVRGESDFADTELDQNAYYLGAGANFYRGDAYLLSTALVSMADNQLKGTSDDSFASYTAGLGLQGGYIFDLGYDFKLQPNIFASFTYIHSEAWITGRNADISSGDFYEFRVSPGLRLDKKFAPGHTGYAFGRYVHIEVDGTSMTANNINLPDIDLKPYVEYGLGFSKEWENIVFFAEGLYRNGGREGWEGQLGFKYAW